MSSPDNATERYREQQRWSRILWICFAASWLVSLAVFWSGDFRIINDTMITSSWVTRDAKLPAFATNPQDSADEKSIPVEWIQRNKRIGLLWQLLLIGWFYPGKILIQTCFKNRFAKILLLAALCLLATLWILSRLVVWDEWPGVTLYHNIIGTPVLYLFVPLAFVLYDLLSTEKPAWKLVRRIPLEILLIIPWSFIWAMIQMLVLHWTWL